MSIFRKRKSVVNSGYEGLPDVVASYFRRLDSLGLDEDMRRIVERVKAEHRVKGGAEASELAAAFEDGRKAGWDEARQEGPIYRVRVNPFAATANNFDGNSFA